MADSAHGKADNMLSTSDNVIHNGAVSHHDSVSYADNTLSLSPLRGTSFVRSPSPQPDEDQDDTE